MDRIRRDMILIWLAGSLVALAPIAVAYFTFGDFHRTALLGLGGKFIWSLFPTFTVLVGGYYRFRAKPRRLTRGQVQVLCVLTWTYFATLLLANLFYLYIQKEVPGDPYGPISAFLPLVTAGAFFLFGVSGDETPAASAPPPS